MGDLDVSDFLDMGARVLVQTADRNGRKVVTRLVIEADAIDSALMRRVAIGRVEALLNANMDGGRAITLPRPDGSDPATFYRSVADAYNATVLHSSHPARLMAEQAQVPVGTVHRWIAEARRRGFLPPARKGRAG